MKRNNCYVITGGPGFGKTTLINKLCKHKKYYKVPEIAAELIEAQIEVGGRLIPWVDRDAFEEELLKRKIKAYLSAPADKLCFFDRGIPDAIAFFRSENRKIPRRFFEASEEYKYNSRIFIVSPWKEIYENRPIRPQTYKQSEKLGGLLAEVYKDLGYEIVEIPKTSIKQRAKFVVDHL